MDRKRLPMINHNNMVLIKRCSRLLYLQAVWHSPTTSYSFMSRS